MFLKLRSFRSTRERGSDFRINGCPKNLLGRTTTQLGKADMLLLIGGDGFLGRHLRDALVTEKTDKIYIISGTPKTTTNSTELFVPPSEFSNLIRSATEDIDIIYFAWSSVPGTYANTPWSELEYNVRPLIDYLDKAKFVPRKESG